MVTDAAAADRGRVADYVRRALPRELAEREITWPHSLEYDSKEIRLTLARGDLRVTQALRMGGPPPDAWAEGEDGPWWTPVTKKWAQELARRLVYITWLRTLALHGVDETGRLHVIVWRAGDRHLAVEAPGAEPVQLVLEPGYLVERAASGEWAQVRQVFELQGGTVGEALELGWARLETQPLGSGPP